MRILVVGAGGVGGAIATAASRRDFFEHITIADIDEARARDVAKKTADSRFASAQVDASDTASILALARDINVDVIMNAADPRFVMPIFDAAFEAGANYLDMAMSLSRRHIDSPYSKTGVMLGEEQFAKSGHGKSAGCSRSAEWVSSQDYQMSLLVMPKITSSRR